MVKLRLNRFVQQCVQKNFSKRNEYQWTNTEIKMNYKVSPSVHQCYSTVSFSLFPTKKEGERKQKGRVKRRHFVLNRNELNQLNRA